MNDQSSRQLSETVISVPADERERGVDIKLFLHYVLSKWRKLLLFAVIFAILLGGYAALKGYHDMASAGSMSDSDSDTIYDEALDNIESDIAYLTKGINDLQNIIKSSDDVFLNFEYFKLDPMNICETQAVYTIEFDGETADASYSDYRSRIIDIYKNIAASAVKEKEDELHVATGVFTTYSVINNSNTNNNTDGTSILIDGTSVIDSVSVIKNNENNNLLTLTAMGSTDEIAQALMQTMKDALADSYDDVCRDVIPHKISLIDDSSFVIYDPAVAANQQTFIKELETSKTTLTDLQNKLEDSMKSRNNRAASIPSRRNLLISILKYAAIGVLLGLLLVFAISFLKYVMSDKLHSADEIKNVLGGNLVGAVPRTSSDKKPGGLYGLIDKLSDDGGKYSDSNSYKVLAGRIIRFLGNNNELTLISTTGGDVCEKLKSAVAKYLPNISIHSGGDIMSDPNAIKAIDNSIPVFVVEQRELSELTHISEEIDFLVDTAADVRGFVVL